MKIRPWRTIYRSLSSGRARGKLFVFSFHRVYDGHDPLVPGGPTADQFDWMARFIGENFNVLPFGNAAALLNNGTLPPAAASITFDDGYRDNWSVALPLLRQHGLVATFFVATAFLDGGRMWNDDIIESIRALPPEVVDWRPFGLDQYDLGNNRGRIGAINAVLERLKYVPHRGRAALAREIADRSHADGNSSLMMTADQVRALRDAGMEVGGHTHSHPILTSLDDADALAEIVQGKEVLEAMLGQTIDVFAYPNGMPERDFASRHIAMVKRAGFKAAATTAKGIARSMTNPFLIPRFTPWDRTPARFAARCALALMD